MPPEICPSCGAEVPRQAKVCPECGADDMTGWSERAQQINPDLPEEDFDYDEFVKREFEKEPPVPRGLSWFWWGVALLVLAFFIRLLLR